MLLQSLRLKNIRSYTDEFITFREGSTLLSGDIGSGKSTILLALEFALFGTSRPDLPGESLLRKGSTLGSVDMDFLLNGKAVTISRSLKKDKNGIKQMPGNIIINNTKKELMPTELKAEVISILGYPEEFISKNKNYIFRYTIYTPQEEMKLILQENPETRLDVLRKIFNIDKYRTIRDNLQFYLKLMRISIAVLKTKTEPLDAEQQKLKNIIDEKKTAESSISKITPKLEKLIVQIADTEKIIGEIEQKKKRFTEMQQKRDSLISLKRQLHEKVKQWQEEMSGLNVPGCDETEAKKIIFELKRIRDEHLSRKIVLQTRLSHLQQKIEELQKEIKAVELAKITEKEALMNKLVIEISKKEELENKKTQIDKLFLKTSGLITKNETILLQSRELQRLIGGMERCPTCQQEVTDEHKCRIADEETRKNRQAEELLEKLRMKENELSREKEIVTKESGELRIKENLMFRTELELKQLKEKEKDAETKRSMLEELAKENNSIMRQLQEIPNIEDIENKLRAAEEILNIIFKRQFLEKNILDAERQTASFEGEITEIEPKMKKIEIKEDYLIIQEQVKSLRLEERKLSIELAKMQTNMANLEANEAEINEKVLLLTEEKNRLIRIKEIYHWLEEYFLNLTYTIEKQVMVNIHSLFEELFKEWFSILIDDDSIEAMIDDSFNPIIIQNGYEINFSDLSGGEKTSASLAYRLALNRVINDVVHGIKTKNILILDEPTDGFSSEQLDKVRDVLERLNLKQTIMVSHENKIESFVENVIKIKKQGHVSSAS